MNALDTFRTCRAKGIRLTQRDDRLHVSAPDGSMTDELRQAITAHKPALLALLQTQERLRVAASKLGIPASVVDDLPAEDLQATAEQLALAAGHRDVHGDPLVRSLLIFYLRCLADRVSA